MAFVIPSAFNEETVPVPEDAGVTIRRIPAKTVAVSVFSGYVLDADVARRERILRETISRLPGYTVAPGAALEVSQVRDVLKSYYTGHPPQGYPMKDNLTRPR